MKMEGFLMGVFFGHYPFLDEKAYTTFGGGGEG
jgi:hypothetical protein